MPSPNRLKDYVKDAYYHIYNRGAGKMEIFRDQQDYNIFLYYLRIILSPPDVLHEELDYLLSLIESGDSPSIDRRKIHNKIKQLNNAISQNTKTQLHNDVSLLSFALMPNHFHLLVHQRIPKGIEVLMRRLGSAYSGLFTRKYHHRGSFCESPYKGNHLFFEPELQSLLIGQYIERNPQGLLRSKLTKDSPPRHPQFSEISNYPYSSLQYYVKEQNHLEASPVWLNTQHLVQVFEKIKREPNGVLEEIMTKPQTYVSFVLEGSGVSLEDVKLDHLQRWI